MVTNLNPKKRKTSGRISWGTGELAWTITDKNGDQSPGTNHNETVQNRIELPPGWSHVWGWSSTVTPGIYRVTVYFYTTDKNNMRVQQYRELARKIQVAAPQQK